MDLRQLRCFIAVAEEMHFGRAAERLHIAPPALSRMVRALEEEIGTPLLLRTTRAVTLTRAGLGFLEDAQAILAKTDEAARAARDTADGNRMTLRIGAIDSASASFLPLAIQKIRIGNPQVDIRLLELMTAQQLQMLRTGRIDLALIRPPMTAVDFPFEPLRQEKLVALLPEDHPLAAQSSVRIENLRSEPLIIPAKRARPYAYDLVMAYFATADCVPRIIQETTEKPAILAMVAAGIGVALVPDWMTDIGHKGVCYRPITGISLKTLPPGAFVGMAWRKEQRHSLRDLFMSELRHAAATYQKSISVT
jgi:DNA-binding transcriptional LysR family regulator